MWDVGRGRGCGVQGEAEDAGGRVLALPYLVVLVRSTRETETHQEANALVVTDQAHHLAAVTRRRRLRLAHCLLEGEEVMHLAKPLAQPIHLEEEGAKLSACREPFVALPSLHHLFDEGRDEATKRLEKACVDGEVDAAWDGGTEGWIEMRERDASAGAGCESGSRERDA